MTLAGTCGNSGKSDRNGRLTCPVAAPAGHCAVRPERARVSVASRHLDDRRKTVWLGHRRRTESSGSPTDDGSIHFERTGVDQTRADLGCDRCRRDYEELRHLRRSEIAAGSRLIRSDNATANCVERDATAGALQIDGVSELKVTGFPDVPPVAATA